MVWDKTKPAGTDAASQGDDIIRELKTDLEGAFRGQDTDGVEAKFPGSDTSAPVYRYRGLKGSTASRPTAGEYGLYFDTTRNSLQRDNGSSWDDIGTLIPAGSVMVFYQASAPVGWTKVVTQNDKALRVVSGSGGVSGGTHPLSTPPSTAHTHTTSSYTLVTANIPPITVDVVNTNPGTGSVSGITDDNYSVSSNRALTYNAPTNIKSAASSFNIGDTGSSSPTAFAPAYIDVILCSKD